MAGGPRLRSARGSRGGFERDLNVDASANYLGPRSRV